MSWAKLYAQHCLTCHICTISHNSKVGRRCWNTLTYPCDSITSVSLIGLGWISRERHVPGHQQTSYLGCCVYRASNSPFLSLFLDTGAQEEKLESEKVHPERRPGLPALLRPCRGEVPWLLSPFLEHRFFAVCVSWGHAPSVLMAFIFASPSLSLCSITSHASARVLMPLRPAKTQQWKKISVHYMSFCPIRDIYHHFSFSQHSNNGFPCEIFTPVFAITWLPFLYPHCPPFCCLLRAYWIVPSLE